MYSISSNLPSFSALIVTLQGLAPTLIIVRIAYGSSDNSVQQMVSIHFAERVSQQPSVHAGAIIVPRATVEIRTEQSLELEGRPDLENTEGNIQEARVVTISSTSSRI